MGMENQGIDNANSTLGTPDKSGLSQAEGQNKEANKGQQGDNKDLSMSENKSQQGNGTDNKETSGEGSTSDSNGGIYSALTNRAATLAKDQKSELTAGINDAAGAVRRIGEVISNGEAENAIYEYASKYAETAARKLEDSARYFEDADLRTIASDVESFARQNPALFLGGAFAAGLLAARFLKSTPNESGGGSNLSGKRSANTTGSNRGRVKSNVEAGYGTAANG